MSKLVYWFKDRLLNPFGKSIWYLGIPMTGYDKQQALEISKEAKRVFNKHGMEVWSPVMAEGIKGKGVIENPKETLDWKWPMDKEALNQCWGFINLRADEKSFGCEDEYGRHRYSEWQTVIRVSLRHSQGYKSIANYQTDLIVGDIEEAAIEAEKRWGTWPKRIIWKLQLLNRSYIGWHIRQIKRLFQ